MVVCDAVSPGDSSSSGLGKCHTIQVIIHHTSTSSWAIPWCSVLFRDLVAHQDAVCSCQVCQILVVAKGILILKGGPKSSIPALVGAFQKGKHKGVITGKTFECCWVGGGSLDFIGKESWVLANASTIMFQNFDTRSEILQVVGQGLILSLFESVVVGPGIVQ